MSKELEALERLAMPDELHIKECKKLGIGLTEDYEVVEQALLELQSIKGTNPSEALECLEVLEQDIKDRIILDEDRQLKLCAAIKQSLQKAQEQKQYLKWEDLEFNYGTKEQKVKMGDTIYKIVYSNYDNTKGVQLLSEDEKLLYFSFVGKYKDNVQLFNDLHLEVVE